MGVQANKLRRELRRIEREQNAYQPPTASLSITVEAPPSTDTGTGTALSSTAMPYEQLSTDPTLIVGERAQRTYKVPINVGGVIKVRGLLTEIH